MLNLYFSKFHWQKYPHYQILIFEYSTPCWWSFVFLIGFSSSSVIFLFILPEQTCPENFEEHLEEVVGKKQSFSYDISNNMIFHFPSTIFLFIYFLFSADQVFYSVNSEMRHFRFKLEKINPDRSKKISFGIEFSCKKIN